MKKEINGIEKFREYFKDYKDDYAIIGGTACSLLLDNMGLDFRATKDIDMVVICKNTKSNFIPELKKFIKDGKYKVYTNKDNKNKFYRFIKPVNQNYPVMIELFSKEQDFNFKEDKILTSFYDENEKIYSISAIVLNEVYYNFLINHKTVVNDISIIDVYGLIVLKAKAYVDLYIKNQNGESIESHELNKHQYDVYRLLSTLSGNERINISLEIKQDLKDFIKLSPVTNIQLRQIGINLEKPILLNALDNIFQLK